MFIQSYNKAIQQRGLIGHVGYLAHNAQEVGIKGTIWSAPLIPFEIANAPKGYKLSDGLSKSVSDLVITPSFTTIAYIGLACLVPEIGAGWLVTIAASAIAAPAAAFVETRLNRAFRTFRDYDKTQRRLQLGYQDSALAQTYRQNALQELTGAFSSSRRYLGNEARFLHR